MKSYKSLLVSLLILSISTVTALAAVPAGLVDDFTPIEGVVLMASDGEVLIDATAVNGVQSGDLFSVIGKSEQILHPQTGQLLGERNQVTGLLQVVQVRPGFSITRQLAGTPPTAGTRVLRFEQTEARFLDLTGQGRAFYEEMRQAFPQLTWSGYEQIDQTGLDALRAKGGSFKGLQFLLAGKRLEVRGPAFELLHGYDRVALQPKPPTPSALSLPAAQPPTGGLTAIWSGMAAKKLPIGLVVADLDGDGRQEIARAFEDRVEIGRLIAEQYTPLQMITLPGQNSALALSSFDLNGNGRPELFVTVAAKGGLNSQIFEYDGERYRLLVDQLRWFLNVVNLPGEGEVLLAQDHDQSRSGFSADVFRLIWQDGKLVRGAALALPAHGTVYSLSALPGGTGQRMVRFNDDGRLEVYGQDAEPLWISSDSGFNETGYTQPDPQSPGGVDTLNNIIYLPPPLLVGGPGLILSVMNQGVAAINMFRQMNSAQVASWNWTGIEMERIWMQELDGYIPAMQVADANNDGKQELAVLLAFPSSNPFGSRKSVLRLYDIK